MKNEVVLPIKQIKIKKSLCSLFQLKQKLDLAKEEVNTV